MKALILIANLIAAPAAAEIGRADIVLSGEVHDNPSHQLGHAKLAAQIGAKAVVFEMLTAEQADGVVLNGDAMALADRLGWKGTGWPPFAHYYPIFEAVRDARIYGAGLPSAAARAALQDGIANHFGAAAQFGLDRPVSPDQLEQRLQLQADAHCGAMPDDMLPVMVEIQRLRDVYLARAALRAFQDTGGPVLIVTGNGHARTDWGVPAYLKTAAPDLIVYSQGQAEAGDAIGGLFDTVRETEAVPRDDPCKAFNAQ